MCQRKRFLFHSGIARRVAVGWLVAVKRTFQCNFCPVNHKKKHSNQIISDTYGRVCLVWEWFFQRHSWTSATFFVHFLFKKSIFYRLFASVSALFNVAHIYFRFSLAQMWRWLFNFFESETCIKTKARICCTTWNKWKRRSFAPNT